MTVLLSNAFLARIRYNSPNNEVHEKKADPGFLDTPSTSTTNFSIYSRKGTPPGRDIALNLLLSRKSKGSSSQDSAK